MEPQNSIAFVSPMNLSDVPDVVAVHLSAFPGFFLSGLGRRFLALFYAAALEDASGISLVSRTEDGVQGFAVGTVQPSGFYKRIISRRGVRFALAACRPMLANPKIIPRLLGAFKKTTEYKVAGSALLMSIGVAPALQGRAVGRDLMNTFLEECRRRRIKSVYLTTDGVENDRTNQFYLRMGFGLSRTFITAEGRVMNEYRLVLEQPEAPQDR